ncbi:MAG: SMC-Scp complex subunit ScpB [Clostridium sp.]|nr:SMC-Scp complex subunit ScpB [Clostridium sp.]
MEDKIENKITSLIDYAVDKTELKGQLEALLFAAGDPISVREIASVLQIVPDAVEVLLEEMTADYQSPHRGIQVIRLEDKIQLTTKIEYSDTVLKLAEVNERQTLSKGALECLAIIAYKQPVTRVEIDEIRGVSSQYVLGKLLERSFITVIGRKKVPGKPKLYATTDEFLRQFGFDNLKVFTQDETYQELMNQMSNDALLSDDDILPDFEGDEEDETQLTLWN